MHMVMWVYTIEINRLCPTRLEVTYIYGGRGCILHIYIPIYKKDNTARLRDLYDDITPRHVKQTN
jgi:hypothetical protein